MNSQTEIFRRRVSDSVGPPPPTARHDVTVEDAVALLRSTRASGIVLLDDERRPAGILTEADVARRVALSVDGAAPVSAVMTAPVISIEDGEYLYRGIARMRRRGLRHLPVVDGAGRLVGMLHMGDALAAASEGLVERIDRLTADGDEAQMRAVKDAEVLVARELLDDNVPATDVQGLITHVNNDLYRRVTLKLLENCADAPPAAFAVIVMGSGGRGENFLYPDQDNGIVIADYPDADHDRIDAWFVGFAEALTARMDAIGFPFCNGHVMATNPLWRKTQSQWIEQVGIWVRKRRAAAVMFADIFFDFVPIAGETDLARPVRDRITALMAESPMFIGDMQNAHEQMHSPLGLFGRFRTQGRDPAGRGVVDVKRHGLQPVVAAARLRCLRAGIDEVPTLRRLEALSKAGDITEARSDEVRNAFSTLCEIVLRTQIASFEAGQKVTNQVAPSALRARERKALRDAFRVVDSFSEGTRAELTGRVM
jgi:CBS domain-containing protein